jgi:hypothetical protein
MIQWSLIIFLLELAMRRSHVESALQLGYRLLDTAQADQRHSCSGCQKMGQLWALTNKIQEMVGIFATKHGQQNMGNMSTSLKFWAFPAVKGFLSRVSGCQVGLPRR